MIDFRFRLDEIRQVIGDLLLPDHFHTSRPLTLDWQSSTAETVAWEVYRGQLAPVHLSRETRTFETWSVFGTDEMGRSAEPLISVKLDAERGEVHVVRGLLCYVWEGYDAGGNVIESREVQRWVRELVGTIHVGDIQTETELRERLALQVFNAVVGSSRLPLTSLEAPMPAWTLGRLGYFHESVKRPHKELEWLIRSTAGEYLLIPAIALTALRNARQRYGQGLRAMFNEVSLSPYTDFVAKSLKFLDLLAANQEISGEQHVDFLAWLLRQLGRHLTAYDLVTFHHRGANYPDALLLNEALKEYLRLIEMHPSYFDGEQSEPRQRRLALLIGWVHRRRYEGHPVPDEPTSPGENARVLPSLHVRVPEEQILNLGKRKKRLYAGDPLDKHAGIEARAILRQCGQDLQSADTQRELGRAIFIERPLAAGKAPGEPDDSPLLAHEAYSRSLAHRGFAELAREAVLELASAPVFHPDDVKGIPASTLPSDPASVVALADAAKAAPDFVIMRTLPGSVREFCSRPEVSSDLKQMITQCGDAGSWLIVATTLADGKPGLLVRNLEGTQSVTLRLRQVVPSAYGC